MSRTWWPTRHPSTWRLRHEDFREFEARLGHRARPSLKKPKEKKKEINPLNSEQPVESPSPGQNENVASLVHKGQRVCRCQALDQRPSPWAPRAAPQRHQIGDICTPGAEEELDAVSVKETRCSRGALEGRRTGKVRRPRWAAPCQPRRCGRWALQSTHSAENLNRKILFLAAARPPCQGRLTARTQK